MKKITLNNQDKLKELQDNYKPPESLDEIIEQKFLKDSLNDNGITNFKEVTNLNNISFGHFILIEKILGVESLDIDEKVKMVSPIILRPLDELKLDNEDREKEQLHVDKVNDEPLGNIIGAFNRFMKLRKEYLYKTYNGVIYGTLDDDEDDDEDEGTSINSGTSAREFHTKKFFWNTLISDVANGDIFKFDDAVELMMSTVMPYLAQKKSLGIVEYLEHKASLQ